MAKAKAGPPKTHLSHDEMQAVLARGESVLFKGQIITSVDQLPTEEDIAETEDERLAVADNIDAQIARLEARRSRLPDRMVRQTEETAVRKAVPETASKTGTPVNVVHKADDKDKK